MTEAFLYTMMAGVFGLIIGSFLNVCISRLPDDYSIDEPRSQCPRCGRMIQWYDNLPVVSFVMLGGKGRCCGEPISFRYPVVEALTCALFVGAVYHFGATWAAVKWCVFSAILVELIFSDLETRILPDEFTKWGMALGVMFSPVVLLPYGLVGAMVSVYYPQASGAMASFVNSVLAAALLGGGLWFLGWAYERLRGREGLGFGDVKMVAMMGAFLGLETTLVGLMAGSLLGTVLGLAWIKLKRQSSDNYELPFGSFLGVGALLAAILSF
ncbi:prepilin peptidase [uncultured Paludibaculum sp.]|uniref:prepilin peptidase n=1 Tax=uncultured Paludibaculum sp. TaxID=1765020 RepID=UPI002AAC4165|nr:prepilin peptidase [uncultured Paludibaculum sp.]